MSRRLWGIFILIILFSVVPCAWAGSAAPNGNVVLFLLVATAVLITSLLVFLLWRLKRARNGRLSAEHGSIQKLSILIILAGCFITLVSALAWFALDRIKENFLGKSWSFFFLIPELAFVLVCTHCQDKREKRMKRQMSFLLSLAEAACCIPKQSGHKTQREKRDSLFFLSLSETPSPLPGAISD